MDWIDIAKGIAIILVVVGHTLTVTSPVRAVIFSFHMPLFFVLAGYTFRPKPWGELLSSSFRRLLVPYLLLFALWSGPTIVNTPRELLAQVLRERLLALLFASGTDVPGLGVGAIGISWFLVALFASRVVLNLVVRLTSELPHPLAVQGVICLALAGAGVLVGSELGTYLPLSLDVAMVATLFMWFGMVFRQRIPIDRLARPLALVALAAVWVLAVGGSSLELAARRYDPPVVSFVGACAGTLLFCGVSRLLERVPEHGPLRPASTYLRFMGRGSMLVFCIHAMDWWIPWQSLALLNGVPFSYSVASVLRVAYDTLYARLVTSFTQGRPRA